MEKVLLNFLSSKFLNQNVNGTTQYFLFNKNSLFIPAKFVQNQISFGQAVTKFIKLLSSSFLTLVFTS